MHGKFGSFLFSFYSKIILYLTLNKKDLFLNKKYSFFTIIKKKIKLFRDIICQYSETKNKDLNIVNEKSITNSKSNYGDKE